MLDRHAAAIAVSSAARGAMARYFTAPWESFRTAWTRPSSVPDRGEGLAGQRLLWLGRIEPRNDLGTVLAAMPRILERHPAAHLTVVGDGPWRARMERAARRLGPCVEFAGYANGGRPDFYRGGRRSTYVLSTRASFA